MFKFSKIATLEKNKLSTDAPFLICIEMKNDMLDEPVRLVRNTEDIIWNKSTWYAYPVEVENYTEDGKTLPALNLKVSAGGGTLVTVRLPMGEESR